MAHESSARWYVSLYSRHHQAQHLIGEAGFPETPWDRPPGPRQEVRQYVTHCVGMWVRRAKSAKNQQIFRD
jgi:hypothetical protein